MYKGIVHEEIYDSSLLLVFVRFSVVGIKDKRMINESSWIDFFS